MTIIATFERKLKFLLNEKADQLSFSTGFIKRRRKITGSSFAKTLIIGHMGRECSLEGMCELFSQDDIALSKQAIDFRFTPEGVHFMRALYEESLSLMQAKKQVACQILKPFNSVKILDSTYITLPPKMSEQFRGYGSTYHKDKICVTQSALKIQLLYNYTTQTMTRLDVKEGVRSDQGYREYLESIQPGDLFLADLGYFVPHSFDVIHSKGAYFISRYKADTNVYDPETHEKIDLEKRLHNQSFFTQDVLLGRQAKLRVRLVGHKLTPQQAAYRRQKANSLAKSRNYISSTRNQNLLQWSLLISNIPTSKVGDQNLASLYRIRWQIELFFKLCKSYAGIDHFSSQKTCRVLCQFYAKLIGIVLFQSMANFFESRFGTEFSPMKAFSHLKTRTHELYLQLRQEAVHLRDLLKNIFLSWTCFCVKDKYRKSRLSTFKSLILLRPGA